eukprot:891879-Lingulodinium_polyedra.AAC.1
MAGGTSSAPRGCLGGLFGLRRARPGAGAACGASPGCAPDPFRAPFSRRCSRALEPAVVAR